MKKEYKPVHGMWTSRWVFILAATGSAVGLGNIWRFPYITGEYGGGAFVVLYLLCIALMGIPIMVAEVMLGRRGGLSPIHTMSKLAEQSKVTRRWAGIGYLGALSGFLILSFYSAVASWALIYVWEAAQGVFQGITAVQSKAHYEDMLANPWLLLGSHTLFMVITMGVVALGVKQGLERAVRVLMPVLFALLVVLIGYASTTPGFAEGVGFLFAFDFSKLSGEAVIVALGQAFFTLSLGMAIMMAYGSYLGDDVSVGRTAVTVSIMDTVVALMAGLAIFPVVFANGLEAGAGPGLIFQTLPLAFGQMPMGSVFGALFFVLLLFAAWTSAISLLEPVVEWLEDKLIVGRVGSTVVVGVACWLLGIASILSLNEWSGFAPLGMFERFEGNTIFDLLDFFTANVMLPLSGLLTALFVGWCVAKESLQSNLALSGGSFALWYNLVRFVTPVAVAIVFVYNLMS